MITFAGAGHIRQRGVICLAQCMKDRKCGSPTERISAWVCLTARSFITSACLVEEHADGSITLHGRIGDVHYQRDQYTKWFLDDTQSDESR